MLLKKNKKKDKKNKENMINIASNDDIKVIIDADKLQVSDNSESVVVDNNDSSDKNVTIDSMSNVVKPTSRKKNVKKTMCRVIVATPTYFVINKYGENIVINKKNKYHRGEEVLY